MIIQDKFEIIDQKFFELNMLYNNLSSAIKYSAENCQEATPLVSLVEILDEKFINLSQLFE